MDILRQYILLIISISFFYSGFLSGGESHKITEDTSASDALQKLVLVKVISLLEKHGGESETDRESSSRAPIYILSTLGVAAALCALYIYQKKHADVPGRDSERLDRERVASSRKPAPVTRADEKKQKHESNPDQTSKQEPKKRAIILRRSQPKREVPVPSSGDDRPDNPGGGGGLLTLCETIKQHKTQIGEAAASCIIGKPGVVAGKVAYTLYQAGADNKK